MSLKKLNEIAERNGDIVLSPLSNITQVTTGKNGFGRVTIALPNEWISRIFINDAVGGLFLTTKAEFEQEEPNDRQD